MTENNTQASPAATTTETVANPAAAITPVQLNVNDIVNGTTLLRVAIERGVFKAEEIAEVGAVYNKLNGFVQYLQAVAQAESQAKAAEGKTDATTATSTTVEAKKKRSTKKSS